MIFLLNLKAKIRLLYFEVKKELAAESFRHFIVIVSAIVEDGKISKWYR